DDAAAGGRGPGDDPLRRMEAVVGGAELIRDQAPTDPDGDAREAATQEEKGELDEEQEDRKHGDRKDRRAARQGRDRPAQRTAEPEHPAVRMTPAVDADEEATLRPQDTHELGEGVAPLARRPDHAARDHDVRGAGANRQREVVALDEARAALRLVRTSERFAAQVDADHGAAR